MADKITGMLKEKMSDWLSTLSDEEKLKYKDLEFDRLIDELMKNTDEEKKDKTKARRKAQKKEAENLEKKPPSSKDSSRFLIDYSKCKLKKYIFFCFPSF